MHAALKAPAIHTRTPLRIRYRAKRHPSLPHVVKLSGGRSSAIMLLGLIRHGLLEPDRGDVVVFNNTSAEHPATYRFVARCASEAQQAGIPCLLTEFQTYETQHQGQWIRRPTYRLVNAAPRTAGNPDGLHWRGETYEELVSWNGLVPNQFNRTCTHELKIETTRRALADWLSGTSGLPALGHTDNSSRIDPAAAYTRHRRAGGQLSMEAFTTRRRYLWSRPHRRPAQRYHTHCTTERRNPRPIPFEIVSLMGIRADEAGRAMRIEQRGHLDRARGEHVYMPLVEHGLRASDVGAFWKHQPYDLELESGTHLSNCVYCFLKGRLALEHVDGAMRPCRDTMIPGFGALRGTPCDLEWWKRMQNTYGRPEHDGNGEIGFFGAKAPGYEAVGTLGIQPLWGESGLPCDCTD